MTVLGVDTIAIVVSDPRKAIEWYRDVLGLDVAYIGPSESNPDPSVQGTVEHPGHWVELGPARPRTRVHLCFMRGETEPGPSGITFISDDIQSDSERMRRQGVEFPLPPEKMEWGEWLGQFADLDGNVFDLKQPLSAAEWKAGSPPAKPRKARRAQYGAPSAPAPSPKPASPRKRAPHNVPGSSRRSPCSPLARGRPPHSRGRPRDNRAP